MPVLRNVLSSLAGQQNARTPSSATPAPARPPTQQGSVLSALANSVATNPGGPYGGINPGGMYGGGAQPGGGAPRAPLAPTPSPGGGGGGGMPAMPPMALPSGSADFFAGMRRPGDKAETATTPDIPYWKLPGGSPRVDPSDPRAVGPAPVLDGGVIPRPGPGGMRDPRTRGHR